MPGGADIAQPLFGVMDLGTSGPPKRMGGRSFVLLLLLNCAVGEQYHRLLKEDGFSVEQLRHRVK